MKYEIIAHFLWNGVMAEHAYKVPVSIIDINTTEFFTDNGFREEQNDGYVDYIKIVNENTIQNLTDENAASEVMSILEKDINSDRIILVAHEMDIIDDDGTVAPRCVQLGDVTALFTGNGVYDEVIFTSNNDRITVKLYRLKKEFEVDTMFEVMEYLEAMTKVRTWTWNEIFGLFEHLSEEYPTERVRFSLGQTNVYIEGDDDWSPVSFVHRSHTFTIPRKKLCLYCNHNSNVVISVFLMNDSRIRGMGYDELKAFIEGSVDDAISVANKVFFDMKDLDGNPAVLHALAVGMAGRTKDEMIVGFLHDVIEDSDWTAEDLRRFGFSREVIDAVMILTHDKNRHTYWEYLDNIIQSGNMTAIMVKRNDLIHNLQRGRAGKHNEIVAKHEKALRIIEDHLNSSLQQSIGRHINP